MEEKRAADTEEMVRSGLLIRSLRRSVLLFFDDYKTRFENIRNNYYTSRTVSSQLCRLEKYLTSENRRRFRILRLRSSPLLFYRSTGSIDIHVPRT